MKKVVILFLFAFQLAFAQKAELFINDSSILLGEPVFLTLKVVSPSEHVVFPVFKDSIASKVEILKVGKIDTTMSENAWEYSQVIEITSFDSGLYVIPIQKIKLNNSEISSNSLLLQVNNVKVDLQKNIKDIAPVLEAPLTWQEIAKTIGKWLLIILCIVLLIIVVRKLYLKYKSSKNVVPEILQERAFMEVFWEKLSELEQAKFWQQGKVKEHHSKASELMRSYLEYRYQINALENTTSNILQQLRGMALEKLVYEKIKQSLLFADMVKFAKAQGIQEQHEKVISNLKELVAETNTNNE